MDSDNVPRLASLRATSPAEIRLSARRPLACSQRTVPPSRRSISTRRRRASPSGTTEPFTPSASAPTSPTTFPSLRPSKRRRQAFDANVIGIVCGEPVCYRDPIRSCLVGTTGLARDAAEVAGCAQHLVADRPGFEGPALTRLASAAPGSHEHVPCASSATAEAHEAGQGLTQLAGSSSQRAGAQPSRGLPQPGQRAAGPDVARRRRRPGQRDSR